MNIARFGVVDPKCLIGTVSIRFIDERMMQVEDVIE